MELLIFLVLLIFVAIFFLKIRPKGRIPGYVYGVDQPFPLTKKNPIPKAPYPYKIKGPLFSVAERSFYGVLIMAVGDKACVFGKVRIADILEPEPQLNKSEWYTAFNKIKSKHFDYVLCNHTDLSIISVIELDDKSHNSKKQHERDLLVEGACQKAGLTLHRFKARDSYDVARIQKQLFPNVLPSSNLNQEPSDKEENTKLATPEIKNQCPRCTSLLVTRLATKGSNKGKSFIACSAYPKCRYINIPQKGRGI